MRTPALHAALLLLAFHAQAQPLGEKDDHVPAQDQPGADVQGMTISFEGDERSTRDASGERPTSLLLGSAGQLEGLVSAWRLG